MSGWMALAGAAMQAAAPLLQKSATVHRTSTLSKEQKVINRQLFDFIQGVTRNSRGQIESMDPIMNKLKNAPERKIAGLTEKQKGLLSKAEQLGGRVGSVQRPGEGTGIHFAALGAVTGPGDTIVVGEDGPEKLHVAADGTVVVEPNPNSLKDPESAQAKSEVVKKQMGADVGMAAGGTITPHYKIGDNWYDSDTLSQYTSGVKPDDDVMDAFNNYLDDSYNSYSLLDKKTQKESGQNWNWYQNWKNKGGSDKMLYQEKNSRWALPGYGNAKNYMDEYGKWLDTLETSETNPYLDNTIGQYDSDKSAAFEKWYNDSDLNKYYDSNKTLGYDTSTGKLGFENPFQYTDGSMDAVFSEFDNYYNNQQQKTSDNDSLRASIMERLGSDYSGFNDYLDSYNSGVLKNQGMSWDATTGDWKLAAGDDILAGMDTAVNDYLSDQQSQQDYLSGLGTTEITADDLTRDSSGNWIVDPNKYAQGEDGIWSQVETPVDTSVGSDHYLETISQALSEYTDSFDSDAANEGFDKSIYDPTIEKFNNETVADIYQQFGDDDLFGSQATKTVGAARSELENELASSRSDYITQMKETHANRGLTAAQSMMSLASLPETLRSQKASTDYTQALTDQVFNNAKWTDAMMNADLDMQEANTLAILWQLYGMEQVQDQASLDAAMTNWFQSNTGGLDMASLLGLMNGYMGETQVAAVTA